MTNCIQWKVYTWSMQVKQQLDTGMEVYANLGRFKKHMEIKLMFFL